MNARVRNWPNRVYYWAGGVELGEWREIVVGATNAEQAKIACETIVEEIEQAGRVAHLGSEHVGPPEGPPSVEDLARVGFL